MERTTRLFLKLTDAEEVKSAFLFYSHIGPHPEYLEPIVIFDAKSRQKVGLVIKRWHINGFMVLFCIKYETSLDIDAYKWLDFLFRRQVRSQADSVNHDVGNKIIENQLQTNAFEKN